METKVYKKAILTIAIVLSATFAGAQCVTPTTFNLAVTPAEDSWATNGQTIAADACFVYEVTCTVGKAYTFKTGCANGATAAFDTHMELFDAAGASVSTNDDGCEAYRSKITWTANETSAFIKVKGYNSSQFGAFTVAYEYTEPGSTIGSCSTPPTFDATLSAPTAVWQTSSGSIAADACYVYKVVLPGAQTYVFKTGCGNGGTADFDTFLELYDASGTWISQNDDGCLEGRSKLTHTSSGGATVYLKVKGYNEASAGAYTLAYTYGTAAVTCKTPPLFDTELTGGIAPSTSWQTASGTIAADACDVYKITLLSGQVYTFKTGCGNSATAGFDSWLELYDASGTWLMQDDDGCEEGRSKITYTAPGAVVVFLKVKGYNASSTGSYDLAYTYGSAAVNCTTPPLSDGTLAAPTTSWQTQAGSIAAFTCYVHKVTLPATDTYTFQTGCGNGTADFDTWMELYDATGDWIAQNDDGCEEGRSKITYAGTASEVVYVKVKAYTPGVSGTYSLGFIYGSAAVSCKTPPSSNEVLTAPTGIWQADGGTIAAGECYVYSIALPSAQTYTFQTGCGNGGTANFDTFLEFYDASGNWISQDDDGCEDGRSKITYTSTGAEAVFLVVKGYNASSAGSYNLAYMYGTASVTCKTPPSSDITLTAPTASWQTVAGSVAAGACYVYEVVLPSAQTYVFKTGCGNSGTADFDSWMDLFDSSGDWIMQNDDGCEEGRSKITYTSTGGETVYLRVKGYSESIFGSYTLAYTYGTAAVTCTTPPLSDEEPTTPSTDWLTDTETLAADECHVYKFTLISGETYTFQTGCGNGATADFDTFLELYDASGTWIQQNDDGCEDGRSKTIYTAPGNVVVYLKVKGYGSLSAGTYTLAYTYGIACKTPPLFDEAPTAPTTGWLLDARTVAADACYIYKFTLISGETYTFKTGCGNSATADFDTWLELYDATGAWLAQNDDGCESGRSKISYTSPGGVDVFLKVKGYNGVGGAYTLAYTYGTACEIPPLFDETLAQPSISWQTDTETLGADECHIYRVQYIKTGVAFSFKTGCGNSATADFDTFLELYDDSGTWLAQNGDGCESGRSIIAWTATYGTGLITDVAYLKVRGNGPADAGDYTLAYNYVGSDALLGTNNQSAGQIKVYPNPADHLFTIVSQKLSFTNVNLHGFTGRLVKSWTLDQPISTLQINSLNFAPGVYFLSVETSEGWIRKKVSIIH